MKRPFLSSIYIKARQLLLPLCTVCLLASTIHFLNFTAEDNFIKYFFNKFCTSLWFLKTAFSCFVFSKIVFWFIKLPFISNNKCLKLFILIISIIITQIIPFLNTPIKYFTVNIGTMYPAFIIGLFIKKHWDTLVKKYNLDGENAHTVEFKLKLDSNPEFTGSVLVAYARAVYRMYESGTRGALTVLDVPPALLSPLSAEELRAHLI